MVAKGTKTAHGKIARFLTGKLTKTDAGHRTPRLITSVKEISRHTGVNEKAVEEWLSEREREMARVGVVMVRVDDTDVVIRLSKQGG